MKQNYYGSLCTEVYEILHETAPKDELNFYLSYGKTGMKILEPLCGSGRFLVPFLERGYDISGIDCSAEMLEKLREKAPNAKIIQSNITEYETEERFDYIFISSGSVSLFTDISVCKTILKKMRNLLEPGGQFVFAVDTVACRCPEDVDYKVGISVKTKEGYNLIVKGKDHYDEKTRTQFSPSVYELYDGEKLLQREPMDFQTHLYAFGEMEQYLKEIGFSSVVTYSSFEKDLAVSDDSEMFLYACMA